VWGLGQPGPYNPFLHREKVPSYGFAETFNDGLVGTVVGIKVYYADGRIVRFALAATPQGIVNQWKALDNLIAGVELYYDKTYTEKAGTSEAKGTTFRTLRYKRRLFAREKYWVDKDQGFGAMGIEVDETLPVDDMPPGASAKTGATLTTKFNDVHNAMLREKWG